MLDDVVRLVDVGATDVVCGDLFFEVVTDDVVDCCVDSVPGVDEREVDEDTDVGDDVVDVVKEEADDADFVETNCVVDFNGAVDDKEMEEWDDDVMDDNEDVGVVEEESSGQ